MIAGCREKSTEWMRRDTTIPGKDGGCWSATPERERERKVRLWLRQGWIMPKLVPFLSTDHNFFENLRSGVANTFPHKCGPVNCSVENISLYDCIDLCCLRAQKRMGAWSYVTLAHWHRVHLVQQQQNAHQDYVTFTSLNWIDNTSAGGCSGKLANFSLYTCLGESRFFLGQVWIEIVFDLASSSNLRPETCSVI